MKKILAILFAVSIFLNTFRFGAFADYVIGNENYGDQTMTPSTSEIPFEVDIIQRASRYAVDVTYTDMNLYVQSAVWNVDEYTYEVTMDTDPRSDGLAYNQFMVTVDNHSDRTITATLTATPSASDIIISKTVLHDIYVDDAGKMILPGVTNKTKVSAATLFTVSPPDGNGAYVVNRLVMAGDIVDGASVVGTISLTVTQ